MSLFKPDNLHKILCDWEYQLKILHTDLVGGGGNVAFLLTLEMIFQ